MRRVSEKHKKKLKEYSSLRKQFLTRNIGCQCVEPGGKQCGMRASQVHHRKGRGKYLNIVASWMAVCSNCHNYIEKNRSWSKMNGYLLNRLSKKPIPPLIGAWNR